MKKGIKRSGVAIEIQTGISQLTKKKKNNLADIFGIDIKDTPNEVITQGIDDIIKSKIILVFA